MNWKGVLQIGLILFVFLTMVGLAEIGLGILPLSVFIIGEQLYLILLAAAVIIAFIKEKKVNKT